MTDYRQAVQPARAITCPVCGARYQPWMEHTELPPDPAPTDDPDEERLVGMGFPPAEVRVLLARARAEHDPDPYRYVMGALIR